MHDFTDFRQPNFTKFEYNTLIGVAMNTFGNIFQQWVIFPKKPQEIENFFNVLRLQTVITPQ